MATIASSTAGFAARRSFRELHGVVVKAGFMQKTVKVRVGGQRWNKQVKKHFDDPQSYLVHDPNDSLRQGDVVAISPGWRTSKSKRHVVKRIIAPAEVPIEERPPIPSEEERWEAKDAKRAAKLERRAERQQLLHEEWARIKAQKVAAKAAAEAAAASAATGRPSVGVAASSDVD